MRYLFVLMMIVSVFYLRPDPAAGNCAIGLTNCTGQNTFSWCSYNGTSFWDKMFSYGTGTKPANNVTDCYVTVCNSGPCYLTVKTDAPFDGCFTFNYDGTVNCNQYACVDFFNGWQTSATPFSCGPNLNQCVTSPPGGACTF